MNNSIRKSTFSLIDKVLNNEYRDYFIKFFDFKEIYKDIDMDKPFDWYNASKSSQSFRDLLIRVSKELLRLNLINPNYFYGINLNSYKIRDDTILDHILDKVVVTDTDNKKFSIFSEYFDDDDHYLKYPKSLVKHIDFRYVNTNFNKYNLFQYFSKFTRDDLEYIVNNYKNETMYPYFKFFYFIEKDLFDDFEREIKNLETDPKYNYTILEFLKDIKLWISYWHYISSDFVKRFISYSEKLKLSYQLYENEEEFKNNVWNEFYKGVRGIYTIGEFKELIKIRYFSPNKIDHDSNALNFKFDILNSDLMFHLNQFFKNNQFRNYGHIEEIMNIIRGSIIEQIERDRITYQKFKKNIKFNPTLFLMYPRDGIGNFSRFNEHISSLLVFENKEFIKKMIETIKEYYFSDEKKELTLKYNFYGRVKSPITEARGVINRKTNLIDLITKNGIKNYGPKFVHYLLKEFISPKDPMSPTFNYAESVNFKRGIISMIGSTNYTDIKINNKYLTHNNYRFLGSFIILDWRILNFEELIKRFYGYNNYILDRSYYITLRSPEPILRRLIKLYNIDRDTFIRVFHVLSGNKDERIRLVNELMNQKNTNLIRAIDKRISKCKELFIKYYGYDPYQVSDLSF